MRFVMFARFVQRRLSPPERKDGMLWLQRYLRNCLRTWLGHVRGEGHHQHCIRQLKCRKQQGKPVVLRHRVGHDDAARLPNKGKPRSWWCNSFRDEPGFGI